MAEDNEIGCLKAIGIGVALLIGALIFTFFWEQLGRFLSIFPGYVWTILILIGISLYAKLTSKK